MSMSIGGISPYAAYDYLPPQPPEPADGAGAADTAADVGMDDIAPVDFSQVLNVQNKDQVNTVQSVEGARGSDRDALRREHSPTQLDLRDIQASMMVFSAKRMWELLNTGNT